jgi:methionine-rich copper-binding protein CopC
MRLLLAVGLVAMTAAVFLGGPADRLMAHAQLERSEPAAGAEVRPPVTELIWHFTPGLKQSGSWVQVTGSDGARLPGEAQFDPANPRVLRFALPDAKPDMYSVRWQSLSADDDDYADGSYSFTVLNPDGSRPNGAGVIGDAASDEAGDSLPLFAIVGAVGIVLVAGFVVLRWRPSRQPSSGGRGREGTP